MRTFLLLAALLASPASALMVRTSFKPFAIAAATSCPRVNPSHVDNTQGYADGLRSGNCFVSIGPMSTTNLIYRAYTIFGDGLLMVFSSYGDGEDSNPNLTSAREFRFFPRRGAPALHMSASAGTVSVTMADGGILHIDPATAQIRSLDRGSVTVSSRVDPAERGGVEITSYAGLMLDGGFRMGESPAGRPEAEAAFRDAQGHVCKVKNKELFVYANGDHDFKFTDAQLKAWLAARCPSINPGY